MPVTHALRPDLPRAGWTADRLVALPADGLRYECVDGELLVSPGPAQPHQLLVVALIEALRAFAKRDRRWRVGAAPADIELDPHSLVQPDVFLYPSRLPKRLPWRRVTDLGLVIEVLSPSTARQDRLTKRRRYQRAGIAEVWLFDLEARAVERFRAHDDLPEIVTGRLRWSPDPAAPPLVLDLHALFREALDDDA